MEKPSCDHAYSLAFSIPLPFVDGSVTAPTDVQSHLRPVALTNPGIVALKVTLLDLHCALLA
jgi:hypothetical protein